MIACATNMCYAVYISMIEGSFLMHLQESGEMYLETILILSQKNPYVRAIDVGEYMGFSKPSVSRAIGLLKNGGYITADGEGHLSSPTRENILRVRYTSVISCLRAALLRSESTRRRRMPTHARSSIISAMKLLLQ